MSSLSLREQLLLGSILAAVLTGVIVKHWRDARREVVSAVVIPAADTVRLSGDASALRPKISGRVDPGHEP